MSFGFGQSMAVYSFQENLDTKLERKMFANELLLDEDYYFLLVNYGNKPTYIVVFDVNNWQVQQSFRLPNWVEFSGAYYNEQTNSYYIKESRYGDDYYALDMANGDINILNCSTTPRGCPMVEPQKTVTDLKVLDNQYRVMINKKNKRMVKVYKRRE